MRTKILTASLVCFLIWSSQLWAEKPQPAEDSATNNSTGAGGASGDAAAASGSGERISGGSGTRVDVLGMSADSPATDAKSLRQHSLACPKVFDKDGVYICYDPDGVWTVFWCGKQPFEMSARVSSQARISVKASAGPDTKTFQPTDGLLEISGMCGSRPGIVQFSVAGTEVEFEVLVDQKSAPDRIYVGAQANSPLANSFRLQTHVDAIAELPHSKDRPRAPVGSDVGVKPESPLSPSANQGGGGAVDSAHVEGNRKGELRWRKQR